jgi:hypothetical protein
MRAGEGVGTAIDGQERDDDEHEDLIEQIVGRGVAAPRGSHRRHGLRWGRGAGLGGGFGEGGGHP